MKVNRIPGLLFCFSIGVSSVIILYFLSPRINSRKNGFVRLIPPHRLDYIRDYKLNSVNYYMAGWNSIGYYLGNSSSPGEYLFIDNDFSHASVHILQFQKEVSRFPFYLRMVIDTPTIVVYEGTTPVLWTGMFGDTALSMVNIDSIHFLNAFLISHDSWILKTYDRRLSQTILIKKKFITDEHQTRPYVLDKHEEGVFSTDGAMEFDADTKHLFYTYFYKNKFVCLDTNLNTIYTGKTIDTVSSPSIKVLVDENRNMGSVTGSSVLVNTMAAVTSKYLFVRSNLIANNESKSIFDRTSVIDIYSALNGKYKYSFYIPDYQEEKLLSFKVRADKLLALYNHYLVLYRINYLVE